VLESVIIYLCMVFVSYGDVNLMATLIFYGHYTKSSVGETGLTPTINIYQITRVTNATVLLVNGGATFEIGDGMYGYRLDAADLGLYDYVAVFKSNDLTLDFRDVASLWSLYGHIPSGNGIVSFSYTLTDSTTALPVSAATVWATTDLAGVNIVATGVTNTFGIVIFNLDPGTYYFWAYKPGYNLGGPDTEVVV